MPEDESVEVGRLDPADWLGRRVHVVIDRPLGSVHPNGSFSYELNYGFVPGYISPDGEDLDAYVVGVAQPLVDFDGVVIGVVLREDDDEDKLIVSGGERFPATALQTAVAFQERFFTSQIVVTSDR